MSVFLEKSTQSIAAAKKIVKESYYASTVNRSYYGCVHFMMYIIFVKIKKDKTDFYSDVRNGNDGTHTWAAKIIENELAHNVTQEKVYKWFQVEIKSLRKLRVLGDYHDYVVSQSDAYRSIDTAETIINNLKKAFK